MRAAHGCGDAMAHDAASAQRDDAVLRAVELTRVFGEGEAEVHALRGVSVALRPGEFVVLLGPSGCGKSTLLNILGGLDRATTGQLYYRGRSLTDANEGALTRYRREHVGFVFQFYNLVPSLTARENVALVTDLCDEALDPLEALELVDLGPRAEHFPSQLSGGEQQRVAIARAIAKRPDLLLCDEPTGALDAATGRRVLSVLDRVNRELGTATAVITHNAPIAAMATRVLSLADGRVVGEEINATRVTPEQLRW